MPSPLQDYNTKNQERWTVLRDMPEWVIDSVTELIQTIYFDTYGDVRPGVVAEVQREFRLIIVDACGINIVSTSTFLRDIKASFRANDGRALLLLDITAKYVRDYAPTDVPFGKSTLEDHKVLEYLETLLSNGSRWTVIEEMEADAGIRES